ncbi:RRM domain-containing protein [Aphelenchoides fujianensis]|nr:RRM domain-containing protein [Aphelenchoides fujianensis]
MSFIIRLQNLSRAAKSSDIREFFASLSIPGGSVCICGEDAFAGFETDEDARQAMLRDGAPLCGNRVKLSLSSRKEMQEAMAKAQQMAGVLKGLEKIIRADPNANVDVDVARRGLEANSQGATSGPQTANGGSTSWILDGQKTGDGNSSNWTDFLASALKRIEGAADGSTAPAEKPSPSLMGRPAAPATPAIIRGDPRKPLAGHPEERGPERRAAELPPAGDRPQRAGRSRLPAARRARVRERAERPRASGRPYHEKRANEPPFAPNNREFQSSNPVLPFARSSRPNDYEAALRQQQLAAIEQLNVPAVRQYDPEELFVEMSRLPPNLVDLSNLAEFLRPLVPGRDARGLRKRPPHPHDRLLPVVDARERSPEAGWRVGHSHSVVRPEGLQRDPGGRRPAAAQPAGVGPRGRAQTPAARRIRRSVRRQTRPRTSGAVGRRLVDHTRALASPSNRPPTSSAADFKPADLNVFHVLLTNVSFKANEWDLSRFLQELNVRYSKLTHVFEPGSSRSDAWIVECNADLDAANLMENERPLMNRALNTRSTWRTEAARSATIRAAVVRPTRTADFHHRNHEEPSFGHPPEHGGHSSGESWNQPPGRSFRGRGARGRPGRGRGMRGAPRNF